MAEAKKKEESMKGVEVNASFDKETKRKKRYVIEDSGNGVVGTVYVDKNGDPITQIKINLEG